MLEARSHTPLSRGHRIRLSDDLLLDISPNQSARLRFTCFVVVVNSMARPGFSRFVASRTYIAAPFRSLTVHTSYNLLGCLTDCAVVIALQPILGNVGVVFWCFTIFASMNTITIHSLTLLKSCGLTW